MTRFSFNNVTLATLILSFAWAATFVGIAQEPVAKHSAAKAAFDWHQFRGPLQNGNAPGQHPPTAWGDEKNVLWKTPIHGRAWSSPVVLGNEIWLTTATEDGKKMYAVCVELASGKILHDVLLFENDVVQPDHHVTNTYASPTPILDDQFAYISFGAYGTACLERSTAKVVWQRRDLPCNHFRGPGSSPILFENLLIFHMDGFDHKYIVALERSSGKTVWKRDRNVDYGTDNGDIHKAYSTPLVISINGRQQLISTTSKATLAYDPRTGEEIWRVRFNEFSGTARPLFDGQRLYINTGFGKAQLICVKADGKGDVTDTHLLWSQRKGIGSKPSQLLSGKLLFNVSDDGVISRIDVETGEIAWQERVGGNFSASLVATDEHFYAFDHDSKGYAFTLAPIPVKISENILPDGCRASPAIVDNSLIVRTTTHLYRFGEK